MRYHPTGRGEAVSAYCSEEEIAETLGISRGTVKSHTARAMTALRKRMKEGGADGP